MSTNTTELDEIVNKMMKGVPAIEMTVDIGGDRDIIDIREELEGRIYESLTTLTAKHNAEKEILIQNILHCSTYFHMDEVVEVDAIRSIAAKYGVTLDTNN